MFTRRSTLFALLLAGTAFTAHAQTAIADTESSAPAAGAALQGQALLTNVTPRNEIREAQGNNYAGLKQLLASPVMAGTNRWIVGHGIPFRAVAGAPHLAEGEAAVIRPGTTSWTVVARLAVADWQAPGAAQ